MTKEKLIKALTKLIQKSDDDSEVAHIKADTLLLEYINDKDITEVYDRITKMYS